MSEPFWGSNKGLKFLANSVQNPLAKALAKLADIQRGYSEFLCKITNGFMINLDSHVVMVASWDGADNMMALPAMKQREDITNLQRFHDNCAAVATKAL
jgi:hypothetical protein